MEGIGQKERNNKKRIEKCKIPSPSLPDVKNISEAEGYKNF